METNGTLKMVASELPTKLGLKFGWLRDQRKFFRQKKFNCGGGFEPAIPLGGIMNPENALRSGGDLGQSW
jgi:hypothetical protein